MAKEMERNERLEQQKREKELKQQQQQEVSVRNQFFNFLFNFFNYKKKY